MFIYTKYIYIDSPLVLVVVILIILILSLFLVDSLGGVHGDFLHVQ